LRDNFCDEPMLLGYARVSTDDQDLAIQRRMCMAVTNQAIGASAFR
jgi:hypothetical protein